MKLTRREAIKSAVAGLALGATPSAQAQEPGSGTNSISAPQPGIPPSSPQAPHLQQTCYSIPLNEDEDDDEEHYIVLALAFSSDSNTLASAKADGTVRLWDVNAEAVERRYHPSYVAARNRNRSVRYEPVCKTMQILQRTAFPPVKKYDESVPSIAFSSDLKTLAFGAIDDCVKLCDLNTGKICGSLLLPKDRWFDIGRMVFSPDRKMLAATVGHTPCREGSSRIEPPWEAIVWDLTTGNQIYAVPKVEPSTLQFLPDGKTLALTDNCNGGEVVWDSPPATTRLHDVTTGKTRTLFSHEEPHVTAWAISGDGAILAVAELRCTDKPVQLVYSQIVIRKLASGEEIARFDPETDYISFLALSQDGSWLVSAHTSKIGHHQSEYRISQVANQSNSTAFALGSLWLPVAFSPDGWKYARQDENGRLDFALLNWFDMQEVMRKQQAEFEERNRAGSVITMNPYQPPWQMLFVENTPGIVENSPAHIMADNKVILRNITIRSVTDYGSTQIGVRFEMTKEQADILRQAKAPFRLVPATAEKTPDLFCAPC